MKIVDSGIYDPQKHTPAGKSLCTCLHRNKTRGRSCPVYGKIQPLWFFCIFNFLQAYHLLYLLLRHTKDCKSPGKDMYSHLRKARFQYSPQISVIFNNDLPGPVLLFKPHIQLRRLLSFFFRHRKRKV